MSATFSVSPGGKSLEAYVYKIQIVNYEVEGSIRKIGIGRASHQQAALFGSLGNAGKG
ncbi:MAG: hypothetical protein BWY80_00620 [Firmicutes bacterium ADurb.Bin456]|nr:MAG: hypothetical protein BWY80_00620 [Firmicutes bacterium ADurb.Bin456]